MKGPDLRLKQPQGKRLVRAIAGPFHFSGSIPRTTVVEAAQGRWITNSD
jgi:hypothetical protein